MKAIVSRRMQFVAGPQEHTFYACLTHLPDLQKGDFSGCFRPTAEDRVVLMPVEVLLEEDQECDLCREG